MASKTTPYSIAKTVRDRAVEFGNNPVFSFQSDQLSYLAVSYTHLTLPTILLV